MALFKTLIASILLTITAAAVTAPAAFAQGTKVGVIDQARIMRDSAAGKDIAAKVKAIETQMQGELQPAAATLETEGQAIEARTANMTREAVAADAALVQQIQGFQQKAAKFQQDRGIRAQELALTERKAWGTFFQSLEPVLQEVVDESGTTILLDRSEVVYAGEAVDLTASVISKMDAKTPKVTVTREKLPAAAPAPQ